MDRLAKQQACQLFIEQEIEKGVKAGKSKYKIGQEIANWIEKLFQAKVKPKTIAKRAERIATNVAKSPDGNGNGYRKRYWLTPPDLYSRLNEEFHFDFDPCPYPLPDNYDSLSIPWGSVNFVNPPFCEKDGPHGGLTAFVHKAIEEQAKGKTTVLLVPVRHYINLLIQAGAELRPLGRIPWLEVNTKEPRKSPDPTLCAILRPSRLPKTRRKREKPLNSC